MLIWKQTTRFALHHSPSREQREILRTAKNNVSNPRAEVEAMIDVSESSRDRVSAIQSVTRQKIAMLTDLIKLDQGDAPVSNLKMQEFVQKHGEYLRSYFQNVMKRTLNEKQWISQGFINSLTSIFAQDITELERRDLTKYGPSFSGLTSDSDAFAREYIRNLKGWPATRTITDKELMTWRKNTYIPSAFIDKNQKIHINIADESLDVSKMRQKMRAKNPKMTEDEVEEEALKEVEQNRDRTVIHELTHYALNIQSENGTYAKTIIDRMKRALSVQKLSNHPQWIELEKSVRKAFSESVSMRDETSTLHEAIAISKAGQHNKYDKDDPRQKVTQSLVDLIEACAQNDPHIVRMLAEIDASVDTFVHGDGEHASSFDVIRKQMDGQMAEKHDHEEYARNCEQRKISTHGRYTGKVDRRGNLELHTNAPVPDPDRKVKDQLLENLDEDSIEHHDAGKVITKINKIESDYAWLRDNKASIISRIPPEHKKDETLALDLVLDLVGDDMIDLLGIKDETEKLRTWRQLSCEEKNRLIAKWGWPDKGQYSQGSNESSFMELDQAYAPHINEQIGVYEEAVKSCEQFNSILAIAKKMQEMDDTEKDKQTKHEESLKHGEQTFLGSLYKQYIGKESGVHWLSWYDVVKIYGIYKDAILEKYHSSQKIRTYDAAKALNIYKPLQVDLDKQARSANDEETSKYKEFLEKEGKTYDELFLDTNSEVVKNKHNINRHKAIIDYAADHAWLYSLDRGNGHNVYGLDYEGIWGKRSFDELVEHNAASQDKEKGNGKAKVNNDPDIPLLVEEIERELHHKNIWMVLGIVERLQEKAKYAESNTWCLVTIINALRHDASLRKVFEAGGKGMMDAIGGIGIGQSAWSLTLFKTQRHALIDWIKAGCTDEAMESISAKYEEQGYLTPGSFIPKVIRHIEHKLVRDPSKVLTKTKEDGLNHNTGKILAAQVVKNDLGQSVSIFEDDEIFNGYRDYWGTRQTTTDPSATDDDFFDPGNNGSDIRLLHEEGVKAILRCTSLGQFDSPTKARGYFTQLFMLEEELRRVSPSAHRKFIEETARKLNYWYAEAVNNTNTAKTFGGFMTSNIGSHPNISNKNVCATLWKLGLIDRASYIIFIKNLNEGKLPDALAPLGEALKKLETVKNEKKAGKASEADVKAAQEAVDEELRRTGPSAETTVRGGNKPSSSTSGSPLSTAA